MTYYFLLLDSSSSCPACSCPDPTGGVIIQQREILVGPDVCGAEADSTEEPPPQSKQFFFSQVTTSTTTPTAPLRPAPRHYYSPPTRGAHNIRPTSPVVCHPSSPPPPGLVPPQS